MTHFQCFVFMKTLKPNSQKNVNTYLVWRQPMPFLFVYTKRKQTAINISTVLVGCLRASGTVDYK